MSQVPHQHSFQTYFAAQYESVLKRFRQLRDEYARSTSCGRKFVIVSEVTRRLREKSELFKHKHCNDLEYLRITAHHAYYPHPPDLGREDFDNYLSVFYILVELDCPGYISLFLAKGLDDQHLPITLEDLKREINPATISEESNFHENFYNEQYRWCPMTFDLNMGANGAKHNPVIPLCRKEKIQPRREDYTPSDHISTLWKVEVPEELVTERLRAKVEHSRIQRKVEGSDKTHYQFALKQYPASKHSMFEGERVRVNALRDQDGMVRYFGWFRSYEIQGNQSVECYNLVLELGDMDLSEAFQRHLPPTSPQQILDFWERMRDLAIALNSIHKLEVNELRYNVCHGDIKPENILLVDGRFKIADPAEAGIEVSTPPNIPETSMTGGTVTYASPEKSRCIANGTASAARISLKSDVWSLGCVFSLAATYVVLGSQGVIKYNRLRRRANQRHKDTLGDSFHDESEVLPEVTYWHNYLRGLARKSDNITQRVLDMIDRKMLIGQVERRAEAIDIYRSMGEEINETNSVHWDDVTPEFEAFLDEVQELAESEAQFQLAQDDGDLPGPPGSEISPSATIHSDFKSTQELLSQPVMPVILRAQQPRSSSQASRSSSRYSTPRNNQSRQSLLSYQSLGRQNTIASLTTTMATSLRGVTNMWMVETELEKLNKSSKLNWLLRRNSRAKSVKQTKQRSSRDELGNHYEFRDIVFLIDNGPSMAQHWTHASKLVRILAWRALGYDDDGMELYFTNPDTQVSVQQNREQDVEDFVKAMRNGEPQDNNTTRRDSGIITALMRILTDYSTAPAHERKPKTILILTDGIWEGTKERDVDTLITSQIRLLGLENSDSSRSSSSLHRHSAAHSTAFSSRPVTFQFIRFGHDPAGMERLRRLDDDLKERGFPDLVDTEPADGDVYKMFLGSISEDMDEVTNVMNSAGLSAPSPLSPSSRSNLSFPSSPDVSAQ